MEHIDIIENAVDYGIVLKRQQYMCKNGQKHKDALYVVPIEAAWFCLIQSVFLPDYDWVNYIIFPHILQVCKKDTLRASLACRYYLILTADDSRTSLKNFFIPKNQQDSSCSFSFRIFSQPLLVGFRRHHPIRPRPYQG